MRVYALYHTVAVVYQPTASTTSSPTVHNQKYCELIYVINDGDQVTEFPIFKNSSEHKIHINIPLLLMHKGRVYHNLYVLYRYHMN